MTLLPAEVAELIIDRCDHLGALSCCSLVCKAWHTRARFCLFSGPVKVVGTTKIEAFVATLQNPLCSLHPYVHSLSIYDWSNSRPLLNYVIPALVGLSNLTSLDIDIEKALLADEANALFCTHFRSIRHLTLRIIFATCADAVNLVCSFPLLETLRLHSRWIGSSPPPIASLPVNLHTLDLGCFLYDVLNWLLSCPPSAAISSVHLRDVSVRDLETVFQYVRFVATTLKSLIICFLGPSENITDLNLGIIDLPELRSLEISGRYSRVHMIVRLLSHIRAPLEHISFYSFLSINPSSVAWAELEERLSGPAYPRLRKVTISTRPHLQRAIQAKIPRLHQLGVLEVVFPEKLDY
ncbi:hypothetical protein C8F04DRAFT_1249133 [Mycena alexandri]|uniref:F-box domain-containing protein n=1 Tax=Mycena alexandri TaxID=1745969 RepID=A0AAD6TFU6_9AGAR|nr:hypothetical protein C8F04DRAFT_1249133 [Mycena alexandri]